MVIREMFRCANLYMEFLLELNENSTAFMTLKSFLLGISMSFLLCISKKIQNGLKGSGLHISSQRYVSDKVFVTKHKCEVSSDMFRSLYHVRAVSRGDTLLVFFHKNIYKEYVIL